MSDQGETRPAGEGLSDEEMAEQVANQTASDLKNSDVFEREADGAATDTEAAKASADELAGEGDSE
jgi:protease I